MKLSLFKRKKEKTIYSPSKSETDTTHPSEDDLLLNPQIPGTQIKMGIKESKLEAVYKVKRSLSRTQLTTDAIPFWKSTISIIALTFSIITVMVISFLIYYFYPQLPENVPLFYDHGKERWALYDKSLYFILPAVLGISLFLLWRVNYSVFFFDRRLALVVTWVIFLFSFLSLIGISEILSLIII